MLENSRRIHIIGSTGSGKTYLARRLSRKLNIPYYELDHVMWSGSTEMNGKNSPEVRDRLLNDILNKESWIVEGVYYKWLSRSFELADIIIFLMPSTITRDRRIVTRFIKQRLGIEQSNYKQTFKGLIDMLRWNHKFECEIKKNILDFIEPYNNKLLIIENTKALM